MCALYSRASYSTENTVHYFFVGHDGYAVRQPDKYCSVPWTGQDITLQVGHRPDSGQSCACFRQDSDRQRRSVGEVGQAAVKVMSTEALCTCAFVLCSKKKKKRL